MMSMADVLVICGWILIAGGVAFIYWPIAISLCGAGLVFTGLVLAKHPKDKDK